MNGIAKARTRRKRSSVGDEYCTDIMDACPVCSRQVPLSELQEHVQLHFVDDEQGGPSTGTGTSTGAAAAAAFEGGHLGEVEDGAPGPGMVRCPIGCGAFLLLEELDSHEEAHRLQELEAQHRSHQVEQEAAEFEKLQMKFGFSDKRPGKCYRCGEEGHWSRDCPRNPAAHAARAKQVLTTNPAELARIQQPDQAVRQQPGYEVMPLLQACLQAQQKPRTTVYLSGPVTFCCRGPADSGWGCGYRNIQMQVSHMLLTNAEQCRELFGGAGFIPDIPALQAWLEVAWQAGFDPGGAAMFGSAVQCTRKWIGTTEAAAMLRYFGCRALIMDFYGKADQRGDSRQGPTIHQGVSCDVCGTDPIVGVRYKSYSTPDFDVCSSCYKSEAAQQHAPFHETGSLGRGTASSPNLSERPGPAGAAAAAGGASAGPSRVQDSSGSCQNGSSSTNNDKGRNKRKQPGADDRRSAVSRHQALAEWIWAYFSTPGFQGVQDQQQIGPQGAAAAASQRGINSRVQGSSCSASTPVNAFERLQQRPTAVVMTGKPPLYFQHEGHSRTIVGIERTLAPGAQQQPAAQGTQGGAAEYTLIVLDPGMPQAELLNSLRNRDKWQMKVKRGMHSLARHSELQLLYVAPGAVPAGPERDALKRVVAAERYR